MNLLPAAISPSAHLAHALGWTLLHFCWQGALVALILACVLSLLSRRSAQPRYLAACCALTLIVALPLVTFTRLITAPSAGAHTTFTFTLSSTIVNPSLATPSAPLIQRIAATLDRAMPTLLTLWFAGVLLLLARLSIGLVVARRMKSAATQPPPHDLLHTFRHLARRIGVSRPVRLLNSTLVQVPTVIGWLRPVVLVPIGCLTGLSSAPIEAILAHELAHVRRHDYLISVLQSIVEALLFYHPAVWWISRQIRREREHCCDDLAVTITGDALTYARALSLLEEHRSTLPALTLGANGGILTMRIKRLLAPTQNPAVSQLAALALLGIVIAAAATCITTAAHAKNNQPATNQQLATPYQLWLDQDVSYIITPDERAAFLQLPDDSARDAFIAQFWFSRNTPGSAPNAARAEHYRRIAYANQHFTAPNTPGWQTDRGHIFIVNGPPNTVDSHPSATDGSHPYEVWTYATTPTGQPAQFRFADTCNCGNYQLQSQSTSDASYRSSPIYSHNQQPASLPPTIHTATRPTLQPASYKPLTSTPQSAATADPVHVAAGAIAGSVVFRVNPIYPPDAKANRIQGAVVIEVIIGKDGAIQNINSVTGPEILQQSALDAIRQWIYKPYVLNGQPVEVQSTITINYNLGPIDDQNEEDAAIKPRKIGDSVSAPLLIYAVQPEYSEQAKKDKISGNVLVHLWVDEQGIPAHVQVVRGIGSGLDEKAVEAVKQYRFNPAMEDGRPLLVELNLEVNFRIF